MWEGALTSSFRDKMRQQGNLSASGRDKTPVCCFIKLVPRGAELFNLTSLSKERPELCIVGVLAVRDVSKASRVAVVMPCLRSLRELVRKVDAKLWAPTVLPKLAAVLVLNAMFVSVFI